MPNVPDPSMMQGVETGKLTYVFPYYWGFFIDISHVLDEGYRNIQEKLMRSLNESMGDSSWFIEDTRVDDRVWHMKEMRVYGGSTKLGTSFLGRRVTPKKIIETDLGELIIHELIFFYHEFGTATARVVVEFRARTEISYQDYENLTRSRSVVNQITDYLNTFIYIDCKVLTDKLEEFHIPLAIDSDYFRELISSESIKVSSRKALWEHLVYEEKVDTEEAITDDEVAPFRPLINSARLDGAIDASLNDHIHLYPGFGTSLILTNLRTTTSDTTLLRTVEIAEYYYAATSLLDNLLFDKFIKYSLHNVTAPKIATIQQDMEEIKTINNLLEVFLFVLKDSIINLNAHAKLVWASYEKEWYYSPMISGLEEKSSILNTKYSDLLNELNEKRSQTLNRFVKIFTVFAVIGPLIQFYQVVEETKLIDRILDIDPLILLGAGATVVLLFAGLGTYIITQLKKF